jgi:hypothetical protein
MYQRLRDFHVPAAVLDEIFSNEENLSILSDAWTALENTGLKGDEIAYRIAEIIFRELDIPPDYSRTGK